MPCPHCKITIIKRSENKSAVSAAAYQSGEKRFSEYDQEQKYYPYKTEVTHKEIMRPPYVPPEFAIHDKENGRLPVSHDKAVRRVKFVI